jgi:glutaredoxin
VPRITLLSRPGCHLCDEARQVISKVADDLGVGWEERDITQSEADLREYWEKIPVTLVDGVLHDFWRVSEERLRRALRLSPESARNLGWLVQTLCICSQTTYGR